MPIPRDPSRPDEYYKNTKEQHEALGTFIEDFEMMVEKARSATIEFLSPGADQDRFHTIALHHGALTAKPIFEIFRAIVAESMRDQDSPDYQVKWSRLSEQFFRVDKWSVCRG